MSWFFTVRFQTLIFCYKFDENFLCGIPNPFKTRIQPYSSGLEWVENPFWSHQIRYHSGWLVKVVQLFLCHYQILLNKSNGRTVVKWNIQAHYSSGGYSKCAPFWFNGKRIWFMLSTCYAIKTLSYEMKRARQREDKISNLVNHV